MTRTLPRLLAAAALAAVLAGCGTAAPTAPAPGAPPAPDAPASSSAAAPSTSEATAFLLETPEFSAGFPSEPQENSQEVPDLPGVTATTYVVDSSDYAVTLTFVDYPAEIDLGTDSAAVLEGARDGAIGNVPGGELTGSSATTTPEGLPALDFTGTVEGGNLLSRIVLDGNRLYQLISVGSGDRTVEHGEFVESFTIA